MSTAAELLAAIKADDRLLDKLGSATPGTDQGDELGARLLAWRHRIEQSPIPEPVGLDLEDAVYEHTAASAIAFARNYSATVAALYDPHTQARAEQQQADRDIDATLASIARHMQEAIAS